LFSRRLVTFLLPFAQAFGVGHEAVGGRRVEGNVNNPVAQQASVTALDIVLEPDATMLEHASAVNARLLDDYPQGFQLDAAHHPHISMLQRFVVTADLEKVYNAAATVFAGEQPATWTLRAVKHYYIPAPPVDLPGSSLSPPEDMLETAAAPDRCDSTTDGHDRDHRRICQR
jgi:hypothetical protein